MNEKWKQYFGELGKYLEELKEQNTLMGSCLKVMERQSQIQKTYYETVDFSGSGDIPETQEWDVATDKLRECLVIMDERLTYLNGELENLEDLGWK